MAHSTSTEASTRRRSGRTWTSAAGSLALAGLLSGCISPVALSDGRYTQPIGNAPVISNETPYSEPLRCMGRYIASLGMVSPRIAVGRIADYTGKEEYEGGRKVTQGASLMAISALAKAGVRQVERFDISVSELELKYANNRLIADDTASHAFRRITAGSIPGSDYYLVGGITELNFNIRSFGGDVFIGDLDPTDMKGNAGVKLYVLDVALDLRLVDTQTLEVVDVVSYQKQILGRELRAGVFDFFNGNIIDIGVGERALEPIQLAVRSVIERAGLEMISSIYGVGPEVCADAFGPAGDPLGEDLNGDGVADAQDLQLQHRELPRREPWRWVSLRGPITE
ncbi:MAG: holdfast anchoring protein HfaB [Alphaproteobacteria bacterium]|nr:holdfast anchoring protein HfaB [Alphaproteobacteria bacterium]